MQKIVELIQLSIHSKPAGSLARNSENWYIPCNTNQRLESTRSTGRWQIRLSRDFIGRATRGGTGFRRCGGRAGNME
jgi:hypothetical protein